MGSSSIGPQEVIGFIPHNTTSPSCVIVSEDWPAWLLILQSLARQPKVLAPMTDPALASYPQQVKHVLSIVTPGYDPPYDPPDNDGAEFPGVH
eukprot:533835-Ditylum_brightwellii.AAC.1